MKLFRFHGPEPYGETIRVVLCFAEVPFEDVCFGMEEWVSTYKFLAPTGAGPFLELDDGVIISEPTAINMYLGQQTSLLPPEPLQQARALELMLRLDEAVKFLPICPDVRTLVGATSGEVLIAAGGGLYKSLRTINALVAASRSHFFLSHEPTVPDFFIFVCASLMTSGQIPGLGPSSLDPFPEFMTVRHQVAELSKVQALYANASDGMKCFQCAAPSVG